MHHIYDDGGLPGEAGHMRETMDARLQTLIHTARAFGGDRYHSILLWGEDAWGALESSGAAFGATLYRCTDCAYVIESLALKDGYIEIRSQRRRPATAEDIARADDESTHHHVDNYTSTDIGGAR